METVLLLGVPTAHTSLRSGKREYARYMQTGIMQIAHVNHHFGCILSQTRLNLLRKGTNGFLPLIEKQRKRNPGNLVKVMLYAQFIL